MYYRIPLLACIIVTLRSISGTEEIDNDELGNTESLSRVRRGFNMLRLGRGLQMLRLGKRGLPMLRLGRAAPDNDDLQYWLSLMREDRQVPLPRYGKDLAFQYALMKALKNAEDSSNGYFDDGSDLDSFGFGYPYTSTSERQIRPAPRPGRYRRSADVDMPAADAKQTESVEDESVDEDSYYKYPYARVAPLMRYGKFAPFSEADLNMDKRAMRMLRLGRGMRMLRLGKRPADSAALEEDADLDTDKRALRLLRLGKRPAFRMLRLGRSGETEQEEKRALRLLRLGKKSETEES